MYSKLTRYSFAAILLFTSGCGLKFGEKPKEEKVVQFTQGSCLEEATANFKLFFAGDATDKQVGDAVQCFQTAFQHFKENVRGQNKDSYTPEEIGGFIKSQFFKGDSASQFSTGFVSEVMALKVVLIGGTADAITRDELDGISALVGALQSELIKLNPHMKVIVSKWKLSAKAEEDNKKFNEAKTAFAKFLDMLANRLKLTGKTYQLNNLVSLAAEVTSLMKSDISATIEKARGLVIKAKTGLLGGEASLAGSEWNWFLKTLGEVYFQTLRLKYFHEPLTDQQVVEKWKVYEAIGLDVSKLLEELLGQKESKLITNKEIGEILAALKPIVNNLNINAELITQVGQIKVSLLGDSKHGASAWSNIDFANLNRKVPVLTKNVAILIAQFKHLKVNKNGLLKKEIKHEDFIQAETLVLPAVKELSDSFVASYNLIYLNDLIKNLAKTLLKDKLTLPENFDKIFQVARTAKYTLTGEEGDNLTVANIQLLANVGIRAYVHYVEYSNFVNVFKLEDKEFIHYLAGLVKKAAETLGLELKLKSSHMLTTEEITRLALKAHELELVKLPLGKSNLELLLNDLWKFVLNDPAQRLAKKFQPGFNSVVLNQLINEVQMWVVNQKAIAMLFDGRNDFRKTELVAELTKQSASAPQLVEFLRLLSANGQMNYADKGYLKILTEDVGVYIKGDLIKSNLARLLSRLIIRSFAEDINRVEKLTGISLEEAQFGFSQVKEILFELELVDPENLTFIESRFRESNLFLATSNGDEFSGYEEIHHLVLHILSGIKRADSLKELAMAECVVKINESKSSKTEFGQDCLMSLYFKENKSFDMLPEFIKSKQQFSEEDSKKHYLSLLKAAGHIENTNKTVLLGDANLFPHVVQYVEMIFSTHDTNRNNILERDEALRAFPIFKNLIALLAKPFTAVKEEDLPGVFVYLLKYTRPPQNLAEKLKFVAFIKDHVCKDEQGNDKPCMKEWNIQSTRLDLGKIFNFIADATKPAPPVPPAQAEAK